MAERLRSARLARGLSQEKLALLSDMSRQSVFAYETGRRVPGLDELSRLARALNVDIAEFVLEAGTASSGGVELDGGLDGGTIPPPGWHLVPVYESLPAGGWEMVVAEQCAEYVVPDWLVPNRAGIVAVKASGDSMEPRIAEGSIVFLDTARRRARSGEIVAAVLDGEATLRVFRREGTRVSLEPWNRSRYAAVEVRDTRDLRILGVYIGHWTFG